MMQAPLHTTIAIDTLPCEQYLYHDSWGNRIDAEAHNGDYILGGDIGGTNSNFGLLLKDSNNRLTLCASFHIKSQTVTDYQRVLHALMSYIQSHFSITIRRSCWGIAGFITDARTRVRPTNLSIQLDAITLRSGSGLDELIFINDFEAVGLGIDHIDPRAIVTIHAGVPQPYAQKGCIGAGTGLGKAALLWHSPTKQYLPMASEGGHADCSAQTEEEYQLFTFIHAEKNRVCPISWEDILSGDGISLLYRFLGKQKQYQATAVHEEIKMTGFKPDLISRYAHEDPHCFATFVLYATFYARCAKNFALDILALNGMYIAGGIAAKNITLFKSDYFRNEFYRCGKLNELLRAIPLFVIADYNVSLYGAAAYLDLHTQGLL